MRAERAVDVRRFSVFCVSQRVDCVASVSVRFGSKELQGDKFCSRPIFRAGKTPKTLFFALCYAGYPEGAGLCFSNAWPMRIELKLMRAPTLVHFRFLSLSRPSNGFYICPRGAFLEHNSLQRKIVNWDIGLAVSGAVIWLIGLHVMTSFSQ